MVGVLNSGDGIQAQKAKENKGEKKEKNKPEKKK